jgi:hypothetical protein
MPKYCIEKDCNSQACYNFAGQFALYCKNHVKIDMVNVKYKYCIEPDCDTLSNYNFAGQSALYCETHSKEGMINVKSKNCIEPNCGTQPSYNFVGQPALYCETHSKEGMIDVRSKNCIEPNCGTQPSYNFDGQPALYCETHSKEGMINVNSKKCIEPNCGTQPSYNFDGQPALYCETHSKEGMINVNSKYCIEKDCKIQASYGLPGLKATYCTTHGKLKEGFIKNPRAKCVICKKQALYGHTSPIHCESHKTQDELNLVERICKLCGLPEILDENGVCMYHDESNIIKFRLYKQNVIKNLLDANKIKYDFYDTVIDVKCGKERPDFMFDCGAYKVILEVDEDQHKGRACECEQTRMVNITQSNFMPTFFIRYNPDKYIDNNGNQSKITNKKRHEILLTWLKYILKHKPKNLLTVLYICYDEFNKYKFTDNVEFIKLI